jgi:hypothetical protein
MLVDVGRARETARKYLTPRPVVVVVGRPEWIEAYLGEIDTIEVYDTGGKLRRVARKGEKP